MGAPYPPRLTCAGDHPTRGARAPEAAIDEREPPAAAPSRGAAGRGDVGLTPRPRPLMFGRS